MTAPKSGVSSLVDGVPVMPVLVIRPTSGWRTLDLHELWSYRELLYFLAWRDVQVRYKQTVLGGLWALLQPALTMAVFSLFFGRLAKMPSDGIPYPLFALAALIPWNLFAQAMPRAAESLVSSSSLLTKIYFPRLLIPSAAVLAACVDFGVSLLLLIGALAYYGVAPSVHLMWLPALTLVALLAAAGVGFFLAAANVRFRDVRHTIPFLTQFWLFATPVAYPSSLLPEKWRLVYALNPMVGVVEGFRWCVAGGAGAAPLATVVVSSAVAVVVFLLGVAYFSRVERTFADIV